MINSIRKGTRVLLNSCNGSIKKFAVKYMIPVKLLSWYNNYATDVFLISFPKAGRTWLRTMIGRALELRYGLEEGHALKLTQLSKLNPMIPKIDVIHDDDPHVKKPDELKRNKNGYKWGKVIFLVRDPRDVIVSLYFQEKKRLKEEVGTIEEFIFRERGGIETIVEYYNIWLNNRDVPMDFLLVSYEDLHKKPGYELSRILEFIGIKGVNQKVVKEAVDYSSFDNMRKMEEEDKFKSDKLRPGDPEDPESFKTRKGRVGGYKEYLGENEQERLKEIMKKMVIDTYTDK